MIECPECNAPTLRAILIRRVHAHVESFKETGAPAWVDDEQTISTACEAIFCPDCGWETDDYGELQ